MEDIEENDDEEGMESDNELEEKIEKNIDINEKEEEKEKDIDINEDEKEEEEDNTKIQKPPKLYKSLREINYIDINELAENNENMKELLYEISHDQETQYNDRKFGKISAKIINEIENVNYSKLNLDELADLREKIRENKSNNKIYSRYKKELTKKITNRINSQKYRKDPRYEKRDYFKIKKQRKEK